MNDFSRQDIESLKSQADICEVMRSYGIKLKAVGKNLVACCPWHEDKEASLVVNPEKQLYNCFGCEAKGDVLSFLQLQENLTFPQAVMRLKELVGPAGGEPGPSSQAPLESKPQTSRPDVAGAPLQDLLERVCRHYRKALEESAEAREYLRSRGLWDGELVEAFHIGYCDGSLLKTLPRNGGAREALTEMGILNDKGREHFLGCLVVPLFHPTQGLVGMYGRRLNPKAKVRHLFLPGPKRGVFGFKALEGASVVYLAEGVLDALSLWLAGLRPVSCGHGTGGVPKDTEQFLRRSSVRELRVCFDADRAGEEGLQRLCEQLGASDSATAPVRFKISKVLLPAGDPNEILVRDGPEVLRSFANCLQAVNEEPPEEDKGELPLTETTDSGFALVYSDVRYEVTPRPPYTGSLKIAIRGQREVPGSRSAKFLDRCDLVSARSRTETLRGISQQLSLDRERAENHLREILDTTEEWVSQIDPTGPTGGKTDEPPELTDEERTEALEFLKAPNLVSRVQRDMEGLGYVGEERGKLLLYLVGLSRKLENPLSAIVRSQSGAGKSGMAHLIASLTPPEDVVHYSRLSPQALVYAKKDAYKRKLLTMEERVGGESSDYYIRIMQSAHVLRQAVPVQNPLTGRMETQEFEVEGPIAYIETTTESRINQENASRCFEIFLDESSAQTKRIQDRQRASREAARLQRENSQAIRNRHHNAQRLLELVPIVIPYVRHLTFPIRWLRTRRDNERFLCLIEASALLHQHQRSCRQLVGSGGESVRYVEASLDDYRLAYDLAKDVLRDTLHELSVSARKLLEVAKSFDCGAFTRRQVRNKTGWSQRRLLSTLAELVEMEYLAAAGQQGSTYQYTVMLEDSEQPSPIRDLLHPDELARKLAADSG